jgi:hypothetical protein
MTYVLLCGIFAALALVAALHLARAFCRTRDRLLAFFSLSFAILGFSQLVLGILDRPESDNPLAYIPRLFIFAMNSLRHRRQEPYRSLDAFAAARSFSARTVGKSEDRKLGRVGRRPGRGTIRA